MEMHQIFPSSEVTLLNPLHYQSEQPARKEGLENHHKYHEKCETTFIYMKNQSNKMS